MPEVVNRPARNDRTTRSNGDASRRRLLDVAAEIAGERGYAGTSISEVSRRSGLPNSSIYWHFDNKNSLFAAVIEDSYERWRADLDRRIATTPRDDDPDVGAMIKQLYESLVAMPEFLRFGQLVVLEQHDDELSARAKFVEIRQEALDDLRDAIAVFTGLDPSDAAELAAITLALVDGASLASAAGETTLDGQVLSNALRACVADRTEKATR